MQPTRLFAGWLVGPVMLVLLSGTAMGMEKEYEKGIRLMTTETLKELLANKADFVLFNALSPMEFRHEHIPGSVNMPYEHLKDGRATLPADKDKKLIFYCYGYK